MSLDVIVDEGRLSEIAALLGMPDPAALAQVRAESLRQYTHRQLLEIARRLGLPGVSRLTKDALAARLGKALAELALATRKTASADKGTSLGKGTTAGKVTAASEVTITGKDTTTGKGTTAGKDKGFKTPVATDMVSRKPAVLDAAASMAAAPDMASTKPIADKKPAKADRAPAKPDETEADGAPAVLSHKFEVGRHGTAREEPRTIPWSYGMDRVTAMTVDPERLFVYWEVTDQAIARARAQLGQGGAGAWLNLRIYDVTGRLFDGTNAHGDFDHKLERHDRQWFFTINKPGSQAVVDVGLRSHEGFFVKIARSGRVEFPRRGPVTWNEPEWMSVRSSGEITPAGHGLPGQAGGDGAPSGTQHAGGTAGFDPVPLWNMRSPWEQRVRDGQTEQEERIEWQEVWSNGAAGEVHRTFSWESPMMVSSWEAGPFTYPVEVPQPTSEVFQGALQIYRVAGRTHLLYGPWQVVIRGLGAQFSRQVLARWEVQRSWVAEEGHEVRGARVIAHESAGSSERLAAGSSERRWYGASELRLHGASERLFLSASERRLGGASETLFAGASQWIVRGASERRLIGSSELRLLGASERMFAGASERRLGGASEGRMGGGSESRLGGASETHIGASEGRLAADHEARVGDDESAAYPPASSLYPR
jgi:hypothetical protein